MTQSMATEGLGHQTTEIRRALDLLATPGGIVEIRGLHVPTGRGKPCTVAGYFTDLDKAAWAATFLDTRKAAGTYVILNEINPALLARSPNQLTDYLEPTTGDNDILRRRWWNLDFDSVRPAGISATTDEHCAAQDVARACEAWLCSLGWPAGIVADSGNGAHVLHRVDLPNDAASTALVRESIAAVAAKWSTPEIKVDNLFNASRIWKCYGTIARKGHSMPDRPHRVAQLLDVPTTVQVVTQEQLEVLAATVAKPGPAFSQNGNGHGEPFTSRLNVPRYLTARGVAFTKKDRPTSDGRTVYILKVCPYDPGHGKNGETSIMQAADGRLSAVCMHDSCTGRGWHEFSEAIGKPDPEHYDPPLTRNGSKIRPAATLTLGTRVRAGDRGNIGTVNSHNGDICNVHFVNPDTGDQADVDFPVSKLTPLDGSPVDGQPAIPPPCSLRDLVAAHPALRPSVINGLLRRGETANVIASSKEGKSWLVAGLGLCVATGLSWLDTFQCTQGRVLLIDGELHPEVIAHRLPTVAEAMGIGPEYADRIDVLPLRGMGVDLLTLGPCIEGIEPGRYALIILDAWYRFLPLGFSENDNAQVMLLYNKIDAYASRLNSAWMNIHHASKGDQSGKIVTDIGSGAGSQSRAADTHLILRPHEQDGVAVLEAAVRSWPPVERLAIRWNYPIWQLDTEADPRKLRKSRERTTREQRDDHLHEDRQGIVNAMVHDADLRTKTEIRDAARIGNPRFGYAWASLLSDKTIIPSGEITKGNNRRYESFALSHQELD